MFKGKEGGNLNIGPERVVHHVALEAIVETGGALLLAKLLFVGGSSVQSVELKAFATFVGVLLGRWGIVLLCGVIFNT